MKIAGPLRLNFPKSGLGLSLGVPGLHVGAGPRGRYVRAGVPGTGVYYRKSLNGPKPRATRAPARRQIATAWMDAVQALLGGDPARCLSLLEGVKPGKGPVVHIEIEDDVVVSIAPDACGIAVLRAEALDRAGRKQEGLEVAEAAASGGCEVARIVAHEIRDEITDSAT